MERLIVTDKFESIKPQTKEEYNTLLLNRLNLGYKVNGLCMHYISLDGYGRTVNLLIPEDYYIRGV